ncbi:hypothetical protein ACFSRY_08835 [Pontibacter locisalis]|uniref:Uncharacterized protein n=1 Tax=Pontibacter locisalis TaxID=1719035 RepID=A0ABW5IKX0_9BACT
MIKFYKHLLPSLAVFLVAAFMYQLRIHHIKLTPMLALMVLYMIGMLAGGFFNMIKDEHSVGE